MPVPDGRAPIADDPLRTLLTILGIAMAVPLVLFGLFWFDAIAHMIDVQLRDASSAATRLSPSTDPVPARALSTTCSAIPGVLKAEGQRVVPIDSSPAPHLPHLAPPGFAPVGAPGPEGPRAGPRLPPPTGSCSAAPSPGNSISTWDRGSRSRSRKETEQ